RSVRSRKRREATSSVQIRQVDAPALIDARPLARAAGSLPDDAACAWADEWVAVVLTIAGVAIFERRPSGIAWDRRVAVVEPVQHHPVRAAIGDREVLHARRDHEGRGG